MASLLGRQAGASVRCGRARGLGFAARVPDNGVPITDRQGLNVVPNSSCLPRVVSQCCLRSALLCVSVGRTAPRSGSRTPYRAFLPAFPVPAGPLAPCVVTTGARTGFSVPHLSPCDCGVAISVCLWIPPCLSPALATPLRQPAACAASASLSQFCWRIYFVL